MRSSSSISKIIITLAALVIVLAGVKMAAEIIIPFLLSLFIAIICSPLIKVMTARKIPLWLAITILFVLFGMIFLSLAGIINNAINEFRLSIPEYRVLLSERINNIIDTLKRLNIPISISRDAILEQFDPNTIMSYISSIFLGFSGAITNIFVLVLIVVFMLFEAPTAKYKLSLVLSGKRELKEYEDLEAVVHNENSIDRVLEGVIQYLGVKTVVSLMTGILVWVLLELIGVQYAILWATLSFLFNYIPNIGSIIAGVPIVVQALLLNGFSIGIIAATGIIGINMIVGNIIEPKMMGRTLGLSTLVVFLSLIFWGWLLGTVGMLLSVPLTMVIKIALESNPSTTHYANLLSDNTEVKG